MKQLSFIASLLLSHTAVMSAAAIQETLISTQDNIRVEHWERDYRDLQLPVKAKWSVRKSILRGGKQEGVDLIEVDNGRLRFAVVSHARHERLRSGSRRRSPRLELSRQRTRSPATYQPPKPRRTRLARRIQRMDGALWFGVRRASGRRPIHQ